MIIRCKTDRGKVRDTNEDYILTFRGRNYYLYVIADGMGGHCAGEVASKLAAFEVRNYVFNNFKLNGDYNALLKGAIDTANESVYKRSEEKEELKGMGTTIIAALLVKSNLTIAHVGDSRAYLINSSGIKRLTVDHSYVQELINNGSISEEEAKNHPKKNLITKAVGTDKVIEADIFELNFTGEDIFFMCTDGLSNYFDDDEINKTIIDYREKSVDMLLDTALQRGGADNLSAVVIRKEDGDA